VVVVLCIVVGRAFGKIYAVLRYVSLQNSKPPRSSAKYPHRICGGLFINYRPNFLFNRPNIPV